MQLNFKAVNPQRFIYLLGAVLALLSAFIRYKALAQSTFANGWDSYFYLVQIKSWIEEGQMHSPDHSLVYPFMRLLYHLLGDYVLSYKVGAAMLAGLTTFGLFHVAKRWSGDLHIAILIAAISLFSPHLTYFAAQYPKNLLGFVFLLGFIGRLQKRARYYPIIWLILCYFGHRMTFGLAVLFGVSWVLFTNRSLQKIGIALLIGLFLFILSQLLPGVPALIDFQRFEGWWSMQAQWAPYSFMTTFGKDGRISDVWLVEIIVMTLIYFISIPFLLKKDWRRWTLFGIATLLLFPFWKWDLTSMAYRFFLVYILIAPLFMALFLKSENSRKQKMILLAIAITFIVGSAFSWKSYSPARHDANYKKYAQLTDQTMEVLKTKDVELLIAHNTLAAFFTYTTGIHAMPWNPEYEIVPNRLWRLATDIRSTELAYYLSEEEMKMVHKIDVRYYLLPDYLWQKALRIAEEKGDTFLLEKLNTWRNPHRIRPGFLLQKHQ